MKTMQMPPTQQLALLDEVEKIARKLVETMGLQDKVSIVTANAPYEGHSDPMLQIGAFLVAVESVEVKGVIESRQSARYFISHEVLVPGTRYFPDGSGEPDEVDFVDDEGPIQGAENVAAKAIALELELQLNHILQSWDEAKFAEEMQEHWDNMEDGKV